MDIRKFIALSCCLILFFIKESHCSPLPKDTVTKADTTNKTKFEDQSKDILIDDKTSNCLLEAFMVILSDNKDVSDTCKALLGSIQNKDETESFSSPSSSDLQNELQALTSQLREIEADYQEVKRDGYEEDQREEQSNMDKKAMEMEEYHSEPEEVDERSKYEDSDDVFEPPVDGPFMTSSKNDEEEYLVIPMRYLINELALDSGTEQTNGKNSEEIGKILQEIPKRDGQDDMDANEKGSNESALEVRDNTTATEENSSPLEQLLLALEQREPDLDEVNTISRLHKDIEQLGKDLKKLDENFVN